MLNIGAYTLETGSERQADEYLASLEQCARLLAAKPRLGRSCEWIRAGLFRFEKAQHVFFYRVREDGILIVRILHKSMLPQRHAGAENPGT